MVISCFFHRKKNTSKTQHKKNKQLPLDFLLHGQRNNNLWQFTVLPNSFYPSSQKWYYEYRVKLRSINQFLRGSQPFPNKSPKVLPISELPTKILAFCLDSKPHQLSKISWWSSVDIWMIISWYFDAMATHLWWFMIISHQSPTSLWISLGFSHLQPSSKASTFPNIRESSIKSPMHFTKGELPGKISFATVESFRFRFQHLTGCFPPQKQPGCNVRMACRLEKFFQPKQIIAYRGHYQPKALLRGKPGKLA